LVLQLRGLIGENGARNDWTGDAAGAAKGDFGGDEDVWYILHVNIGDAKNVKIPVTIEQEILGSLPYPHTAKVSATESPKAPRQQP